MSTEKPSRNEGGYFAQQNADLLRKQRSLEEAAALETERKTHYMKCPKDGYDLSSTKFHGVQIETCPHCGGVLSAVRGAKPVRFRCQVGHALTGEALAKEQESAVDEALRIALRVIEERAELVERLAQDGRRSGRSAVAELYESRAAEYRANAETIRRAILLSLPPPEPSGEEPWDE